MDYLCPQCGRTGAPRADNRGALRCTFCWERVVGMADVRGPLPAARLEADDGAAVTANAPPVASGGALAVSAEIPAPEPIAPAQVIFVEMPELIDDEPAALATTPIAHPKPKKKGHRP